MIFFFRAEFLTFLIRDHLPIKPYFWGILWVHLQFSRHRRAKLLLMSRTLLKFATFRLSLQRRVLRLYIWLLGRSNGGVASIVFSDDLDLL